MEGTNMNVCWISAGVSSFIAGYLARQGIDKYIYIHIQDQHEDSMRFIKDCENVLEKQVEVLQSKYLSVNNVIRQFRFINSPYGAKCTDILKKRVRKEWESKQVEPITYYWGFDLSEKHRAEKLIEAMTGFNHRFPLIERQLTKQDAHAMCKKLNIKRPVMYDIGYQNNNCIGCVKGGMGYWNKIRIDFPEVFKKMAKTERDINARCLKQYYLDELPDDVGRKQEPIVEECSIFCQLGMGE
jgi:hypothetical protein